MIGVWANLIVEELVRCGVHRFIISPGSRSTPLTLAVARNSNAEHLICHDERGAAFAALGIARGGASPAALICTSGTAAAHYYPAVIEASLSHQPLIIITADRPPELRQSGANQTISQPELFGEYVKWRFDLPTPTGEVDPAFVLSTVDQMCYRARKRPSGPVHLNCMFRKPLEWSPGEGAVPQSLQAWWRDGGPWTRYHKTRGAGRVPAELPDILSDAESGLLLIGQLSTEEEREIIAGFAASLGWPVFADITSNLRQYRGHVPVINHFGIMLKQDGVTAALRPDAILHLGGRFVSAALERFLQLHAPATYVQVCDFPERQDPVHRVRLRIESGVSRLVQKLKIPNRAERSHETADRLSALDGEIERLLQARDDAGDELTEIGVARVVAATAGGGCRGVVLGASMPVRDVDDFAGNVHPNLTFVANRGVSGIDGAVATACGWIAASGMPATLLCGDLTLLHDLNSLALLQHLPAPLTIVLVNNGGGGIFSLLPVRGQEDVFETFFGTPQSIRFEAVSAAFDLPFTRTPTLSEFRATYGRALKGGTSSLIEIATAREENRKLHDQIDDDVAELLRRHPGI